MVVPAVGCLPHLPQENRKGKEGGKDMGMEVVLLAK